MAGYALQTPIYWRLTLTPTLTVGKGVTTLVANRRTCIRKDE